MEKSFKIVPSFLGHACITGVVFIVDGKAEGTAVIFGKPLSNIDKGFTTCMGEEKREQDFDTFNEALEAVKKRLEDEHNGKGN